MAPRFGLTDPFFVEGNHAFVKNLLEFNGYKLTQDADLTAVLNAMLQAAKNTGFAVEDKHVKKDTNSPSFVIWEDAWTASGIRGDSVIAREFDVDEDDAMDEEDAEFDPDGSDLWETEDEEGVDDTMMTDVDEEAETAAPNVPAPVVVQQQPQPILLVLSNSFVTMDDDKENIKPAEDDEN